MPGMSHSWWPERDAERELVHGGKLTCSRCGATRADSPPSRGCEHWKSCDDCRSADDVEANAKSMFERLGELRRRAEAAEKRAEERRQAAEETKLVLRAAPHEGLRGAAIRVMAEMRMRQNRHERGRVKVRYLLRQAGARIAELKSSLASSERENAATREALTEVDGHLRAIADATRGTGAEVVALDARKVIAGARSE